MPNKKSPEWGALWQPGVERVGRAAANERNPRCDGPNAPSPIGARYEIARPYRPGPFCNSIPRPTSGFAGLRPRLPQRGPVGLKTQNPQNARKKIANRPLVEQRSLAFARPQLTLR